MKKYGFLWTKRFFSMLFCFLFLFVFFVTTIHLSGKSDDDIYTSASSKVWSTNLTNISSVVREDGIIEKYIRMSEFVTSTYQVLDPTTIYANHNVVATDKVYIGIATASELFAMSICCNDATYKTSYLNKNYILMDNIDYNDIASVSNQYFMRPIGWDIPNNEAGNGTSNTYFQGTFDGQGFTISNMYYEQITDETISPDGMRYPTKYPTLAYYSMFSVVGNSGTIKNLGFVNPIMLQASVIGDYMIFASALVGENFGTIDHVYVEDNRPAKKAGLIADGGFNISYLLSVNDGIVKDCYVYTKMIASDNVLYNMVQTVLFTNRGTLENVFFYHSSDTTPQATITGITSLEDEAEFLSNAYFRVDNGWFSNTTYAKEGVVVDNDLKLSRPILRGLHRNTNNGYWMISSGADFSYFSYLLEHSGNFRNANFELDKTIDLNSVAPSTYQLMTSSFNGVFTSGTLDTTYSVKTVDNTVLQTNSILNAQVISGQTLNGYRNYGLFPIVSGTISNINVLNAKVSALDLSDSINYSDTYNFGILAGSIDGGTVKNVQTSGVISLDITNTEIGKINAGGLAGHATNDSTINSCVTSGSITHSVGTSFDSQMTDSCQGGIVGFSDSITEFKNNLSCMNLSARKFSSDETFTQYVGGIVGKLNLGLNFSKNSFYGSITVGESDSETYQGICYVGGIIGRHASGNNLISSLYNAGKITYYAHNEKTIYLSGVLNVDTLSGKALYESLSNASNIDIYNRGNLSIRTEVIHTSGVLYSKYTKVQAKGLYNLGKYKSLNNKQQIDLSYQQIDLALISEFGPCMTSLNFNGNTKYICSITNAYNYQQIHYVTPSSEVSFYYLKLSGCLTGYNVQVDQARNEGDILVFFTKSTTMPMGNHPDVTGANDYNKMKVFGCFEEVSLGCIAKNCYNGGDIDIKVINNQTDLTATQADILVAYNIYASGICYKNANGKAYFDENNISISATDDTDPNIVLTDGNIGSLYNSLNSGNIHLYGVKSEADTSLDGDGIFVGCCRVSGIVSVNAGRLSTCYNTGDIYNINHTMIPKTVVNGTQGSYNNGEFEVESAGITFLMLTRYAQILDSANGGTIVSISTSTFDTNTGWVNSSGIVCRNEKNEAGQDKGSESSGSGWDGVDGRAELQKIEFTINYGNVFSWNSKPTKSWSEHRTKAGGILSLGVLNIINVINYGSIYGNTCAGGIYGMVFMSKFYGGSNSNITFVANAINYGRVEKLTSYPSYSNITSFGHETVTTTSNSTNSTQDYGSVIAQVINGGSKTADVTFQYFRVSYLINMVTDLNMIGNVSNVTGTSNYVNEMVKYMATVNSNDLTPAPFNQSTATNIKSYTLSSDTGGIFSSDFPLRNSESITSGYITNQFIADYIQFIPANKTNEYLLEKIGFMEIIRAQALSNILSSYNAMGQILSKTLTNTDLTTLYQNNITNSVYSDVLSNSTMMTDLFDILSSDTTLTQSDLNQVLSIVMGTTDYEKLVVNSDIVTLIYNDAVSSGLLTTSFMDGILTNLINDTTTITSLLTNYPTEMGTYIANYLSSITTNQVVTNELYTTLLANTTGIQEALDNTSKEDQVAFLKSVFGTLTDTELTTLIELLGGDTISLVLAMVQSTLDETTLNTFYTTILSDSRVTDATLHSLKTTFNLSNASIQAIAQILNDNIGDSREATYLVLVNSLTDEEAKRVWIIFMNNSTIKPYITNNQANLTGTNKQKLITLNNYISDKSVLYLALINAFGTVTTEYDLPTNTNFEEVLASLEQEGLLDDFFLYASTNYSSVSNQLTNGNYYIYEAASSTNGGIAIDSVSHSIYDSNYSSRGSQIYSGAYYLDTDGIYKTIASLSGTEVKFTYYNTWGRKKYTYSNGVYTYNSSFVLTDCFTKTSEGNSVSYVKFSVSGTTYTYLKHGTHMRVSKTVSEITSDSALLKQVITEMNKNNSNVTNDMITYFNAQSISKTYDSCFDFAKYQVIYNNVSENSNLAFSSISTNNLTLDDKKSILVALINGNQGLASLLTPYLSTDDLWNYLAELSQANSTNFVTLINQMNQTNDNFTKVIDYLYKSIATTPTNATVIFKSLLSSDSLTASEKKSIIQKLMLISPTYLKTVTDEALANNALSKTNSLGVLFYIHSNETIDRSNILYKVLINSNFYTTAASSTLASIMGMYSYYDNSIFINEMAALGYDVNDSTSLNNLLTEAGMEISDFATNLGIYALASSHGILNGEFMPDNILLTSIDPVVSTSVDGNDITSNIWRGGESQDLTYYKNHVNDPLVNTTVNYHIYYLMKQLRKSIATTIFYMELTTTLEGKDYQITNDSTKDIDLKNHTLTYYIPQNADELKANSLNVNLDNNTYELANKASILTGTGSVTLTPNLRDDTTQLFPVGTTFDGSVTILAEDTTVRQKYTIHIVVTQPCGFTSVTSVTMNGNTNSGFTTTADGDNALGVVTVTTEASYTSGKLNILYATKYLQAGRDLRDIVYLVDSNGTTIDKKMYSFTTSTNNGIVQSTSSSGTFDGATGTVFFEITLNDELPNGTYTMIIPLLSSLVYKVVFVKQVSSNSSFVSLTYSNTLQTNDGDNTLDTSILYSTIFTESDLLTIVNGKPKYLDALEVAPLATYTISQATVSESTVSNVVIKTYTITYIITAEDTISQTLFTHHLIEMVPSSSLVKSYKNGSLISPASSSDSFSKNETPTYRFDYDFSKFNLTSGGTFKVITRNDPATNYVDYYATGILNGKGMEIYFYDSTPALTFEWYLQFNNSIQFNSTTNLTWQFDFNYVSLTKNKSMNSYLDNITFISETVLTSVDTLIENYQITPKTYETERAKQHTVVCLTDHIYYNDYSITKAKQSAFYTIGLVSKTNLSNYSPIFTLVDDESLYRITTINGVVYRFIDYSYVKNNETLHTLYLVKEDMTTVYEYTYDPTTGAYALGTEVASTSDTFTYNSIVYTKASFAGKGSTEDISYFQDFESEIFDSEGNPSYVFASYRVYSEAYDSTHSTDSLYFTDYLVTVMDATSTIRFELTVKTDSTIARNELASIFVYFQNYQGTNKNNVVTIDSFLNYMSVYAYEENGSVSGTDYLYKVNQFSANSSGFYRMCANLPIGYTYVVKVTDRKASSLTTSYNEQYFTSGKYVEVKSTIVTRKVQVEIIISKINANLDWGIHKEQGLTN